MSNVTAFPSRPGSGAPATVRALLARIDWLQSRLSDIAVFAGDLPPEDLRAMALGAIQGGPEVEAEDPLVIAQEALEAAAEFIRHGTPIHPGSDVSQGILAALEGRRYEPED